MRWVPTGVVLLTTLLGASCDRNTSTISVVNWSGESVARVVVVLCGQKVEMANLEMSEAAQATYRITCEGHYSIDVEFQSGRRLQKEVGYVTSGFDFHHRLHVTASDVELSVVSVD